MEPKIKTFIDQHPAWQVIGDTLVGEWQFANFAELRGVVAELCNLADELNHHPTVTYGYNTLRIETTTHDAGNTVTELDLELARRVTQLLT